MTTLKFMVGLGSSTLAGEHSRFKAVLMAGPEQGAVEAASSQESYEDSVTVTFRI